MKLYPIRIGASTALVVFFAAFFHEALWAAAPIAQTSSTFAEIRMVDGQPTLRLFDSTRQRKAARRPLASRGAGASDGIELILQLFPIGSQTGDLAYESILLVAEAVWGASTMTGRDTFTGTLTQLQPNVDDWTYSASPVDKFRILFAGGPTFEYTIAQFAGYTDGTWEEFADYHSNLQYTVVSGVNNLHVVSQCQWDGWDVQWTRSISGKLTFREELMTVNITEKGNSAYSSSPGFSFSTRKGTYTGLAQSPSATITVKEGYYSEIGHNSNIGQHVQNRQFTNDSSAVVQSNTYEFRNGFASWALGSLLYQGEMNTVIDSEYWGARGNLLKNGQIVGTVLFDGPVVEGAYWGPKLVLRPASGGGDIQIYSLSGEPFDPGGGFSQNSAGFWVLY